MYPLIPKLKRVLAPLAQLAVTVVLNMQDGGIKTLSQDVNLPIYLSLLQYCQKANVSVGEIQHLTISTMWDFIGVLLLLRLPLRHQRHKDTKEQKDWPPFTRVVKVDKLAADRRERKATLLTLSKVALLNPFTTTSLLASVWKDANPAYTDARRRSSAGAWKSLPSPG